MRLSRLFAGVGSAGLVLAASTLLAAPAMGAPSTAGRQPDIREIPAGKVYKLDPSLRMGQGASALRSGALRTTTAAAATPAVGTVRQWIALDDFNGRLYRKEYTLRAVGQKIEVWVASGSDDVSSGTAFPAGDCRNAVPGSTDITDAQVQGLVEAFDSNMFPKESEVFSVAPDRDGTKAQITGDFTGDGDKIVALIDNVRDDNFFDFPARPTYIAGFFSSQFNDLLDRNVMTIDAFDWLHRTGANPPDEPTADLCTSRPARPFLYESTFAHEYQHLLHNYTDPIETTWLNEGLSDFAMNLTGYADPKASVFERGAESHLYCFNGFGIVQTPFNPNTRDCGGPQNSLTLWGDEGSGNEILADYGNAWSAVLFMYDRYGIDVVSALHRDGAKQGLASVQAELDAVAPGTKVPGVLHDFQTMNLVDDIVGARGRVFGIGRGRVTTPSLEARLNLDNPRIAAAPGAAPNGADYVLLRDGANRVFTGRSLRSVLFIGARTLPPLPLRWTVVNDAPGNEGNPTLWSGNESNLDSAAVVEVDVPTASPTLTFRERHLAEEGFDYAYTVVSADGGKTYTPLANANTVQGPLGPALNGDSPAFADQTFDLTPYAGKKVLIGFRYVSDGGVNNGGWWIDTISVGGTAVSDGSSLTPFRSPTQISPIQVANWNVRLVGIDEQRNRVLVRRFDGRTSFSVGRAGLARFAPYPKVVAIVGYDDPTEQVQQYAPYALSVNGVTQPGG